MTALRNWDRHVGRILVAIGDDLSELLNLLLLASHDLVERAVVSSTFALFKACASAAEAPTLVEAWDE